MNSQSFLFYFTGVIWNKSHILTVKIIWPMPIFDWRINIKIEASSAVFSPAMCGFFVNHFRQISAKHIIAENSSLVSNKSHALGLDRHNNVATSEEFSSYFVLQVYINVCYFLFWFAKVFAYDVWFMFIYTIYIYFLKVLYQRILRMFSSQRKMERKTERKIERFKYHSHCLCTEVNRNGSDNLVLDIPL